MLETKQLYDYTEPTLPFALLRPVEWLGLESFMAFCSDLLARLNHFPQYLSNCSYFKLSPWCVPGIPSASVADTTHSSSTHPIHPASVVQSLRTVYGRYCQHQLSINILRQKSWQKSAEHIWNTENLAPVQPGETHGKGEGRMFFCASFI